MSSPRDLDVVVFGATGFVGRLVAGYLAEHAPEAVRVGLGGRSAARLAEVRAGLGPGAASWPLLEADATDAASLAALAGATRVVATTAGPYRPHGLAVVEACAAAGTDYLDLAGEVLFLRDSVTRCNDTAAGTGSRIVHCCGFDSIPSDLAVFLAHRAAVADGAGELEDATLVVTGLKGGFSGGTIASGKMEMAEARADPAKRRLLRDPYLLSPDRAAEPDLGDQRGLDWIEHDSDLGMWVGPFVMAPINTRVVRRSNALQDWAYGRRLRYREVMGFGTGPLAPVKAAAVATTLLAVVAGMNFGPSRALLDRVLPAPGEGPSEQSRRTGYFRVELHARTSTGTRYVARVAGQGDPGYAATAVMFGESALALVSDRERLPAAAGVLTPATALGSVLVDRLRDAGQTLAVERLGG